MSGQPPIAPVGSDPATTCTCDNCASGCTCDSCPCEDCTCENCSHSA